MDYRTAGESHGRALTALVSGVPAGVPLSAVDIDSDLDRRRGGYGRGGRMAIEQDRALITSGVRFGVTIGSPVAITIANRDAVNWTDVMPIAGQRPAEGAVTMPRPGHADLAGCQRTGSQDARDVLERASARETAARVAAGGVAKALLAALGVSVFSWVERIGDVSAGPYAAEHVDLDAVAASAVRCPDEELSHAMRGAIDLARNDGDTLGGVVAVAAIGVVPGVGSYAERPRGLDAQLAAALCSIPSVKGVEFGDGFAAAASVGSKVHDPIVRGADGVVRRGSNHAGGLEGGMTNGEPVVARIAVKPIPTLMRPLKTIDLVTGERVDAIRERSDVCAVPAAGIVAEAEVALVLADAYTRMFGDTCVDDMRAAIERYRARTVL